MHVINKRQGGKYFVPILYFTYFVANLLARTSFDSLYTKWKVCCTGFYSRVICVVNQMSKIRASEIYFNFFE